MDPAVCHGKAVVRGMRWPVQNVLELMASGMSTKEIAASLFLSPKTVEFHLGRIFRKLGVRSRAELVSVLAASEHT